MKRFWFNLLWYLAAVILADVLPIFLFLMLHMVEGLSAVAPQLIATALSCFILCVQAFLHLSQLNKRYPERGDRNIWSTLGVTFLVFVTLPVIVLALIVWAMSFMIQT
ncbi:MAG: hypothetical protein ACYC6B_08865 [Thermoleophilia bacterium]